MSGSHRTPYDTASTSDTGGGCAVFLIVAGIAIAVIAVVIMLIMAFITIESDEATVVVVEEVVEFATETPTPQPTITQVPAPTSTPIVIPIPEVTANPEPTSEPFTGLLGQSDYEIQITEIVDSIWPSLDQYFVLSSSPEPGDDEWRQDISQQFEVWESITARVEAIDPPEQFSGSHQEFLRAGAAFEQAALTLRRAYLEDQGDQFQIGVEQLSDAILALSDALVLLSHERFP